MKSLESVFHCFRDFVQSVSRILSSNLLLDIWPSRFLLINTIAYRSLVKIRLTFVKFYDIFIETLREDNMKENDHKTEALRKHRALNSRPDSVSDERFLKEDFFDPRDLVQVKYEMLRSALNGEMSVTASASRFGFSRPTFYRIQAAFEEEGIPGLIPRRSGPQGPHKLTLEIQKWLANLLEQDPELRSASLARRAQEHFGISLHPRTIERSGLLDSVQKKTVEDK